MKRCIFFLLALTFSIECFAQTGTPRFSWQPGYHYHSIVRDSCSASDSDFVRYTPAHNEYYVGFYLTFYSVSGTPLFRWATIGSEITAWDSTSVSASGIGNRSVYIGQVAYPKRALVPGTIYRLQFINSNTPVIRVNGAFITADQ